MKRFYQLVEQQHHSEDKTVLVPQGHEVLLALNQGRYAGQPDAIVKEISKTIADVQPWICNCDLLPQYNRPGFRIAIRPIVNPVKTVVMHAVANMQAPPNVSIRVKVPADTDNITVFVFLDEATPINPVDAERKSRWGNRNHPYRRGMLKNP